MPEDTTAPTWQISTKTSGPRGYPVPWRAGLGLPQEWHSTINDDDLSYIVELELAVIDGTVRCQAMRLEARADGKPISARDVRGIPVGECIEHAVAAASMRREEHPDGSIAYHPAHYLHDPARWREARRVPLGLRPGSDDHLLKVAEVYKGSPDRPTRAVEAWGHCSYSTAARWVGLARRRGFLPPAQRSQKEQT
jgi:hypothetical protein